jgi:peptide/nickel transport system ATP-binding protein
MTGPLLELEGASVRYGRMQALDDVSFTVGEGEIVALIGESGSGKTTAIRALMGLVPLSAGRVRLSGADITVLNSAARRQVWRQMQLVFQDPSASLSPRLTIGEIIAEPLVAHGMALGASLQRAAALLDQVGLPASSINRRVTALSGGQRQRVAIARALALEPRLIIADEPMSALDVSVKAQIANLFLDLREATGCAFLIVSHDLALMAQLADRAVVLAGGKLIESGPITVMLADPQQPQTRALRDACLDPFVLAERAVT